MLTLQQALRRHPLPRLEARMLLQHVRPGLTHARLIADPDLLLSEAETSQFEQLALRRLQGEPMAYLLGEREFYGRNFRVSPAVLIPRPETEHLVEAALERLGQAPAQVVDLGCGSGAIAITLALEAAAWVVSAVDLSPDALQVAMGNAQQLGASVRFQQGSWYQPLGELAGFDLIVSNPPYIEQHDHHLAEGDVRFEPRMALTDEHDGLSCLREIIAGAPARLKAGGWLMLEHGFDQGDVVRQLLRSAGLQNVATLPDLAGLDRVSIGQMADN
ncbi:peptide chain release factor N(5)-glutamine methyltransferase [Aquitalea aquatica]|uniref:Release factor glutamine methyltransferase n=1 Tax=Aquitalea aquatica TaxID=3044273 RepID=A0A838XXK3_9NEIS|nr:peptide chain release factor N(5)-glutamine methyltransferase [Aquitalea magnusonii]MBA4707136.1 peptide chain release factor N(5)-glutamine methyltransferase [Aquitalea magnusonii]